MVASLLDCWGLNAHQGMFKLCMKNNFKAAMEPPFDLNPLTQIWKTIDASQVLMHFFPEYLKLAQMAIVHILRNVEDDKCFSSLAFLKRKLQATLDPHLPFVVGMCSQYIKIGGRERKSGEWFWGLGRRGGGDQHKGVTKIQVYVY